MTQTLIIQNLKNKLSKKLRVLEEIKLTEKRERKLLKEELAKLKHLRESQNILQEVAASVQESAHKRISSLVTKCIRMVMGPSYTLIINFSKKRHKTEANIYICKNGFKLDPNDSSGGGVVDLAAFSLRVACLCMALPQGRKLICMDEPFKFLSPSYRPKARMMIEMLADELGIQFIFSTHSKKLQTGTIIEVE